MSTRERSTGRAPARRRAAGSMSLLLLASGTAMGSAHGLATVSSQDTDASTAPISLSTPTSVAPAVSLSRWDDAVALSPRRAVARPLEPVSPVPSELPPLALGAYHRAAAVLAAAAPSCELDWSLLAAVGHVESDHGLRSAADLDADGVSRPAIVGPVIDAPGRGQSLPDTDSGKLDGRADQDRAVGPMQLLPSVWTVAAVDGDGDGRRDPQDIDDAALAAGVLLCTSAPELSSPAGRRQSLRSYNAASGYVGLVQRLATAYAIVDTPPIVLEAVEGRALPTRAPRASAAAPEPSRSATPAETATVMAAEPPSARPAPQPVRAVPAEPRQEPDGSTLEPAPEPVPAQTTDTAAPQPAPAPSSARDAEPATSSAPTPEATPRPPDDSLDSPEPTPAVTEPDNVVTRTGTWTMVEDRFLLDGLVVDVEALGDLASPAQRDLDGDGLVETVREELEGLQGSPVEVRGTLGEPLRLVVASLEDLLRTAG